MARVMPDFFEQVALSMGMTPDLAQNARNQALKYVETRRKLKS